MEAGEAPLAERLAAIYPRLDHPYGVTLGIQRLPILDGVLADAEAASSLPDDAVTELAKLAELLAGEWLGTAADAVAPRIRIVELIRRAEAGRLRPLAFDEHDPFGADMRAILESDADLRAALGRLYPVITRATAVTPSAKWIADARAMATATGADELAAATRRVLGALLRAEIESRPDLLVGGVRPHNQRLARGLAWYAAVALETPAGLLGAVGLRMGTSGRNDAVVRDTAIANSCAALLGEATDPGAPSALASMRARVINRNVLKQVDRAIEVAARRAGVTVEDLVELALPTFGLDADRRLELPVGPGHAIVAVDAATEVRVRWRAADGTEDPRHEEALTSSDPAAAAEAAELALAIEGAIAEERARMDARLASSRAWPAETWRQRFADHPIGGLFGRPLIWFLYVEDGPGLSGLPQDDGWLGPDGRPLDPGADPRIRLWHPAEATDEEVAAWQATFAAQALEQPIRQVHRERFEPEVRDRELAVDRRFAGRILDHARLRALLRQKGWAVPALGAWDQGDVATAWRTFDDGLRAELQYQTVERVATGDRVERARIIAIRFTRTTAAPTAPAGADATAVPVIDVPRRVFSEAVRDVSLAAVVAEAGPD